MGDIFTLAKAADEAAYVEGKALEKGQDANKLLRLNSDLLARIKAVVEESGDKYTNSSHFIRCGAVLLADAEELGVIEEIRAVIRRNKK